MTHKSKRKINQRKRIFLQEFSKVGVISTAADKAGLSLRTIAQWIQHDKTFYEDLHEAKLRFHDRIEKEIVDRIFVGKNGGLLRLKLQAEIPEKYGRTHTPHRDAARRAWAELGRGAARDANDVPPS